MLQDASQRFPSAYTVMPIDQRSDGIRDNSTSAGSVIDSVSLPLGAFDDVRQAVQPEKIGEAARSFFGRVRQEVGNRL